jgi:predicted PurR-regulated permease PerM
MLKTVPDMETKDLRVAPPRRWSDELGGIRWLPRMIDKARAAMNGTLGDYLYGQSPTDRSFLRALGITYKDFTNIVRRAGDDDEQVLQMLLQRTPDGVDLARRWSQRFERRHRFFLYLIDLDDGYAKGPLQAVRSVVRVFAGLIARYIRYHWPTRGSLIGLEIEAQQAGVKAEAARGADDEPYRWLTPSNLDASWKLLLSAVLIGLILTYVIGFLERIGVIVLIIIAAIFFAYLVYPIVRWLNHKLPLILAILVVYLLIFGGIGYGMTYLVPAIGNEVTTLVHSWPSIQKKIVSFVEDPNNKWLAHAPPIVRNELAKLPSEIFNWLRSHGAAAAGSAITVLMGTAAFIGALIIIPILSAYLLYDSENAKRFFMGFVPERRRDTTLELLGQLERVIGGFIRGQILVGLSVGILIAVGLSLIHEPYAILLGALAGALDLIPYIGPFIAVVPALIIAFVTNGFQEAIYVAIVFVIANQAEGHILAPNIVSRTIQLTPSTVMLAVLIGGELYGIIGMFIAVPVAGIIRVLLLHIIPGSVSREEAKPVLTKDPRDSAEEAAAP